MEEGGFSREGGGGGKRRCSGEGDRCTVPGHTAMPESAFREHWPPALRLRSLCGIERRAEEGGGLGAERGRNIESFPAAPARASTPAAGCSG